MLTTLKKRQDFTSATKKANAVKTSGFMLQHVAVEEERTHFGFTTSRKIGNAVIRNRSRRRLKALVNEFLKNDSELFLSNSNYIFIANRNTYRRSFVSLRKDLKYALHQIKREQKQTSN